MASYRTAQRVGNFRRMLSQVTESWTCIQTCVERANDSCSLVTGWRANNLCLLPMGGQREKKTSADLPVKVLISTKVNAGHCKSLRVITTTFDQYLKKKIKTFHDGTDLTARIDRDYQSGATLHFAKNLRRSWICFEGYSEMDWQAIKKGVESHPVASCYRNRDKFQPD